MKTDLLTVSRYDLQSDCTIGKLFLYDKLDGYTVEDEIREIKVYGETAVPYGRRLLKTRISPRFSSSFLYSKSLNMLIEPKEKNKFPNTIDWMHHELIWITDVPDFEYVLLHWGNSDDDTNGCLCVGSAPGKIGKQDGVINSRTYYKQLYPKIYPLIKAGDQYINYVKEELPLV